MRKNTAGKAFVWTTMGLLLGTATSLIILAWMRPGNTPLELTAEVLVYLALAIAVSLAIAATTFSITTRSVCRNAASAIDKVVCGDFSSGKDHLPDGYTRLTDELGRLSVMLENSSRHGAEKDTEAKELKERAQTLEEMLIHANSDLSHKEMLLKEINRELALANHAKTEFISGMGRELRLPLNTIVGLTDFIYHGNLGPVSDKQKEYLKKIRTRADNMLYIVSHVLEYTRLDAGEQMKCEELDLSALAGEVTESISGFAAEKKVTVELDVDKTAIEADPVKLRFILYDILHNAVKFNNPGGKASLSIRPADWSLVRERLTEAEIPGLGREGDRFVEFTIKDTGPGIERSRIDGIFKPFMQVPDKRGHKPGGSGLSLFLTRKFVELHGGWIWAESATGSGTTITFVIPASPDDRQRAATRTRKILIVEDDPSQMDIMSRFLKDDRYVLYKAADGVEALSLAEEVYPDLILLDVMIPRMDGITVCSTLKQQDRFSRFKHVPIVMATSLTEVEKRVEAIQAGADDILIKPVDSKLLKERVRTLLEAKDEFESILASYRDAERNATVDPLTGLYNRRYMEGIMTREFMNARRHGRDLSVLMMDVDHFKNYNDKFGHQAGDNILKSVSKVFRDIVREVDLVARYGGEEFIAILPETPPDMAAMVAERIRTAVEDGNKVTISIGAASYPGDSTDMVELIKDADIALYAAKDAGRNRTVKFSDIKNREYAA